MTVRETKPGRRVRTQMRLQMEATECGAAALAIVMEFFGSFVPLAILREKCGVSRDGSKASNILKAARQYDMMAKGFRKEPGGVREMQMPVIVHWNFNHFLVVEGFTTKRVYLNDPAAGRLTVTPEEFDKAFTGVVLSVQPTPAYKPFGKRPSVLRSLAGRMSGSRVALLYLSLVGLFLAVPSLVTPIFSKVFVDEVLVGGKQDWLLPLLGGMAFSAAIRAGLVALQRGYLLKLLMKLGVNMSSNFLWHALKLPVGFFFARSPGDLAGRMALNDSVSATLSGRLSGVMLDLLLVIFYGAFMFYLSPIILYIGVGTMVAHVVLLRAAQSKRTDLARKVGQHSGKLQGVGAGGLQMIETIKATASENEFFGQWSGYQAKLVVAQQEAARHEQVVLVTGNLLTQVNTLLVLAVGATRVMSGDLTIGALIALQSLMGSFLRPISNLTQVGAELQQLEGDIERLDDILKHDGDDVLTVPAVDSQITPRRLTGQLDLKELTFGYLPFSPPLVSALNLTLAPGQRVALVGGTASGKSTIAKLVCGLYRPWSGDILFDGEVITDRSVLANSVAIVDQDISLFAGTVRENLTLWDDTVPEVDIVQAAKDACIHEDITRLPGGYEAQVTEGGFNLSGGQRQRLEIARALVKHPALVILDEATSALDPETELEVDKNLRRRGCSCLIVAHRLSTIRDCEEILVLEKGHVVQRGSHEELINQGGLYHELITSE